MRRLTPRRRPSGEGSEIGDRAVGHRAASLPVALSGCRLVQLRRLHAPGSAAARARTPDLRGRAVPGDEAKGNVVMRRV